MRWLLFLSRIAFITGISFLVSLSHLIWNWIPEGSVLSTIIVIGYFMGMLLLPTCLIFYGIIYILKGELKSMVPRWLILANILFFLLLVFFIFYWNDPYYHQK